MRHSKRRESTQLSRVETNYGEVVLDEERGQYWHLNPTASLVVSIVSAGGSVDDAVEAILSRYDVSVDQARADVHKVVQQLRENRIL
ncbi:lasso peptide biosynthesis PqqD family chaperone [Micromonospora sp. NPDC047074]|uniref:lasso peptide biosynthesis PqqD family chaperone n=1 Tax=Micromonospora sp. NPDC047074 TaxID=3154339 RepID=UPI003410F097